AEQFIQFIRGNFGLPAVLEFEFDAPIELFGFGGFIDGFPNAVSFDAIELQRRFFRQRHALWNVFHAGELCPLQKVFDLWSLENLNSLRRRLQPRKTWQNETGHNECEQRSPVFHNEFLSLSTLLMLTRIVEC